MEKHLNQNLNRNLNLVFLHGFLGSPRDFSLILNKLELLKIKVKGWGPNFFETGPCSAAQDYSAWTENFLREVDARFASNERVLLLGYSLGARLALHALLKRPARFHQTFLLAANPGVLLTSAPERRVWEQAWAQKFRSSPWAESVTAWNEQEVFSQTTARVTPPESKMSRELIADSLSRWSLLDHKFSLDDLNQIPPRTQWWFGEFDSKFLRVKEELERRGVPGEYRVIKGAGHRLPLDVPELIIEALLEVP